MGVIFIQSKRLFYNTLLLTAASFLMQGVGLAFQAYLTRRIGAAGVGLFILTMSVNSFAATVAITGVRFATMRIVSQELGLSRGEGALGAVRRSLLYAISFGTAAALMLYLGADFVGGVVIGDVRTVRPLRRLAMSLPFMSMGTVFTGYFTAVGKVWLASVKGFFEQIIRIAVSVALLSTVAAGDVEGACCAVLTGGVVGEIGSFLLALLIYRIESRPLHGMGNQPDDLWPRIFGVAIPLGVAAYARTALNAAKNLLTPRSLQKAGGDASAAMADYGMIQGMVFPVITFPAALISSLAELLIPEVTRLQAQGRESAISRAANKIFAACAVFAVGAAGIIARFARPLGLTVYDSAAAGPYILLFSLMIPVMYLDMITDSLLKGLGEQVYSMRINVLDSLVSTLLIVLLLPRYGTAGYVFVLFFSESLNFALSMYKLNRITRMVMPWRAMLTAFVCVTGAAFAGGLLFTGLEGGGWALALSVAVSGVMYMLALRLWTLIRAGGTAVKIPGFTEG